MPLEVMGRDVQGLGWDGDLVVGCLHLQAQNSCPSQIGFLKFPDQLLVVLCTWKDVRNSIEKYLFCTMLLPIQNVNTK